MLSVVSSADGRSVRHSEGDVEDRRLPDLADLGMEQMKKEIFARVRVVTVDLDNTLWKTLPVIKEANKALFHFLGAQYPGILDRFPPESWRALQDKMMENFPEDSHDLSKVRLRAIEYAANICGEKDPAAVSQEAFSVFIQK